MVSRETEQIIDAIRDGIVSWLDCFKDINNDERLRATEQILTWFDNQNFKQNE